jgi:NOL1/NOP2/sun family putative RNA methylase
MDPLERYADLVEEYDAFRAACERPLPSVVRVNPIKTTVDRARAALAAETITVEPREWHERLLALPSAQPGTNWPYVHGWLHGQEEVSALPATVLEPEPGERVWDACAAPGSKTTQLAARMDDRGTLVATDTNLGRLSALRSNAERLGVTNVAITHEDARNHSLKPFALDGSNAKGTPSAGHSAAYDRALVDPPCSCEGTIRKNPTVLEDWTREHVTGIAGVQKGVLRRAVQVTRPGGTVVYSTCTFAPEENEAVLDHALAEEACRLEAFDIPLECSPGVTDWGGEQYDERVRRAKRVYPHQNDTGGFFCAKLAVTG